MPHLRISTALILLLILIGLPANLAHAAGPDPISGRWTVKSLGSTTLDTPGGDITFDPGDRSISGATACNFFRGGYEQSGEALTIKVGMMTRRGCIGDAAEHERAFLEAMEKTRAYQLDGKLLSLTGADGTILAQLIQTPDAALEGTQHKIVSYLKDGGLHSVRSETGATITLQDGKIAGNTGCRSFVAAYTRDGDRLQVNGITPAEIPNPCDESVRDQDAAILAALPKATTFDTSRNLIRLLEKPDGNAVLWITPKSP